MKKQLLSFIFVFFSIFFVTAPADAAPLSKHPTNPRYFTDGSGKAIYLTGSHTWNNMYENSSNAFDYNGYLNFFQQKNHNFIRGWWVGGMHPWKRTGPRNAQDGGQKYDFTQFNQEFFDRTRQRVIAARDRGIYVSVMFFNIAHKSYPAGNGDPFLPGNNINNINGDPNGDGWAREAGSLQNSAITNIHKAYLRKMIDTLNDLDNVLYEIINEEDGASDLDGGRDWQYAMINEMRSYEATKPKQHLIGMTSMYPNGRNNDLFNSPADWISPNADGGYKDNPPAATGNKIIVSDTDHLWEIGGDGEWVWKSFTRGMHTIYMDPMNDEGNHDSARDAMGHTLTYANKMNLAAMTPQGSLSSTGYVLAKPGAEYLVYQPGSGNFNVDVSSGTYAVEWMNPESGSTSSGGTITATGGNRSFSPPSGGPAVLYLKNPSAATRTPTAGATPTPTAPATPSPMGTLCSTLTPGIASIGAGFGTPWNVFNLSEMLVKAFCSGSTITAQLGPSTYVYHQGYAWINNTWQQTTFTCTGGSLVSNVWCPQTAQGVIPAGSTYYVGYTCNWTGTKWNCGCADTTCAQSYWQLQKIN